MPHQSSTSLPLRFVLALIAFTFGGWIGWSGIVLVLLKVIGVIHWQWWVAALPLEYGVIYCLYMTIDGALYRAGLKDVGGYARFTQGEQEYAELVAQQAQEPVKEQQQTQGSPRRAVDQSKIQEIISDGPERIGATIDACSEDPNRKAFAQALLDAALEPYFLLQLAMFANKKVNAHVTIKKWRDAGLKLPAEGTPEFFPYGD
jgi:hypothetical protein